MIDQKKVVSVLKGEKTSCPPIWFMRQAGRYLPEYQEIRKKAGSFWGVCLNPKRAAEVTLQPLRRFSLDAAIIFSDILIVPQSLGQTVHFIPHEGPVLEQINFLELIENYQETSFLNGVSPTLDALELVKEALPLTQTLIGFSGAPWTLATYMLGLRKKQQSPDFSTLDEKHLPHLDLFLRFLSDKIALYLIEQIKRGADVLKIFDSWAASVPPSHRHQFLLTPLSHIVKQVQSVFPDVPILYFGRGISEFYPILLSQIPALSLAFDSSVDPSFIHDHFQKKNVPVQGNLDPLLLVQGGKELDKAVGKILETLGKDPYIFNLGHGILPQTPIKNVEHVIHLVKNA